MKGQNAAGLRGVAPLVFLVAHEFQRVPWGSMRKRPPQVSKIRAAGDFWDISGEIASQQEEGTERNVDKRGGSAAALLPTVQDSVGVDPRPQLGVSSSRIRSRTFYFPLLQTHVVGVLLAQTDRRFAFRLLCGRRKGRHNYGRKIIRNRQNVCKLERLKLF